MSDSFNLGESTDIVAHYTSLDTICEHILPTKKMRFSPLISTNDPYEFKKRLSHVRFNDGAGSYDAYDQETYEKIDNDFKTIVHNNVKVLCLTGSVELANSDNLKCYMHPRMWAQYGNNHEGAALVFDRIALEEGLKLSIPSIISQDIKYIQNFSLSDENFVEINHASGVTSSIYDHLAKYAGTILFNKHLDWASEDERRYACINPEIQGYEYAEYGSALRAIVFGINAKSEIYLPKIRSIEAEIPIYQCAWATRGEYFVYRHDKDSCGGLVVENFEDGQAGTELILKSWPASDN